MKKHGQIFSALLLFLLLFPMIPSNFAQSGTPVKVQLLDELNTGATKPGQMFSGTLAEPIMSGRKIILPRGTAVQGKVIDVVSSGRLKRPASITLQLTNIMGTRGNGGLRAEALKIDGESHMVRDVALIGGGAGAGAILGGVAGGGKGAVIGSAVGAGAGTATAFFTGKKEIVLPIETVLTFSVAAGSLPQPEPPKATIVETSVRPSRPVWREDRDDRRYDRGDDRRDDRDAYDAIIFSERDQDIIRSYYGPHSSGKGLPPGLAKRNGNLPPGLQKQMSRNGTLPPGLQKRAEPFPMELNQQLPRLPAGYSRMIVEGRAMIVGSDNTIIDVMAIF